MAVLMAIHRDGCPHGAWLTWRPGHMELELIGPGREQKHSIRNLFFNCNLNGRMTAGRDGYECTHVHKQKQREGEREIFYVLVHFPDA